MRGGGGCRWAMGRATSNPGARAAIVWNPPTGNKWVIKALELQSAARRCQSATFFNLHSRPKSQGKTITRAQDDFR
jgi:hypothetical protein